MNEQLQKALAEIISKASSGIDTSISFLSAELPDVVHQVLIWHSLKSAIMFLFFATCAAIAIRSAVKYDSNHSMKELRDAYERGEPWTRYYPNSPMTSTKYDAAARSAKYGKLIRISLSFVLSLFALSYITWLQILVAPKLYLIEYAATLVK